MVNKGSGNSKFIVALDQGTTSSRAIAFNSALEQVAISSQPLTNHFPSDGWVEQDPDEIWSSQFATLQDVAKSVGAENIAAIGITNQRETVLAWDRESGKPFGRAIVWQCRRSAEICNLLRGEGREDSIREKTGLVLDPYFSGTKIRWMIENLPGLSAQVKSGKIVFGTVDSWLLYRLTEGRSLATEPSNASRTMLFNIQIGDWDDELLRLMGIGRSNLPSIQSSDSLFGSTRLLGVEIPITGILGDQQASLFGHGCTEVDSVKCTFGTGAFLLVNTGQRIVRSGSGMISTVAWSFEKAERGQGQHYAIEGSVFMAGALIQWLRDKLGCVSSSDEVETVARSVPDTCGVTIVPAFVGLGAPFWDSDARGAIFGLTREVSRAHLVRASLEAVAHQVADLLDAPEMKLVKTIRVDGGMTRNRLFCELLSDLTGRRIVVSKNPEVTCRGAAKVAARGLGLKLTTAEGQGDESIFEPRNKGAELAERRAVWVDAVRRVRST